MARVRQPYTEPVRVPALRGRVVNPGQVVDIPDDQLPSFVAAGWQPVTDPAPAPPRRPAHTQEG